MLTWEFSVLDFIQTHLHSSTGDIVMPLISHLGDSGVVWIVLAVVLLIYPKTRKTGAAIMAVLALEVLCCNLILKPFVARIRSVLQQEQAAVPGPGIGSSDRILPAIPLCPLPHRCAGRGGAGITPGLGRLHTDLYG